MSILNQINNYVEIFVENYEDQRLSEMDPTIRTSIAASNPIDLITIVSELKPQIAQLEMRLKDCNYGIGIRKNDLDAVEERFDSIAQSQGITSGELLVKLGKEIDSLETKKKLTDYAIMALKEWVLTIDRDIEGKVNSMSDEEKQQLYSGLAEVTRQNESQIDLLGNEIAHREFQSDEEIKATAARNGQTVEQVKMDLEKEIWPRKLKIARLEEQNNVINGYKTPLIQTVAVEVHRPR